MLRAANGDAECVPDALGDEAIPTMKIDEARKPVFLEDDVILYGNDDVVGRVHQILEAMHEVRYEHRSGAHIFGDGWPVDGREEHHRHQEGRENHDDHRGEEAP